MKCNHCVHSIGSSLGLLCTLHTRLATVPCDKFLREPGSDDDVQVRPASVAVRAGAMLLREDAPQATDIDGAVSDGAVPL